MFVLLCVVVCVGFGLCRCTSLCCVYWLVFVLVCVGVCVRVLVCVAVLVRVGVCVRV